MIRTFINSKPDLEKDFEAVINVGVAVGAGETCEVFTALEWSLIDRRIDDADATLLQLDRHWQRTANSPESIERLKYGLRLSVLLETRATLTATVEWEREDLSPKRYREVRRALDIVERAIAIAREVHDCLASVPLQLELEKSENSS